MNFHSEYAGLVTNINLVNVNQHQVGNENPDRGTYDVRPPCNPYQADNVGMDNAYTILEGETRPWGVWEYPGGLPALFVDNIYEEQLTIDNCKFTQENGFNWNPSKILIVNS